MSAMDNSFRSRVREVFGALDAGLAPAWSVSGLAQARSSSEGVVVKRLNDLDSDDEEEEEEEEEGEEEEKDGRSRKRKRPVSFDQLKVGVGREEDPEQEFEYGKKMIGMDDTLDFEEEEDEFDRVAEGLDRSIRWSNEDNLSLFDEGTGLRDGLGISNAGGKRSFSAMAEDGVSGARELDGVAGQEEPLATRASKVPRLSSRSSSDSAMRNAAGKPQAGKNVRFAVDEEKASSRGLGLLRLKDSLPPRDRYSKVPDHVRNPSKYTCYSLDWSDEDEESTNRAALRDVQLTRAPQQQGEPEPAAERPRSLMFIARAKATAPRPTISSSHTLDDRKREGMDGGKPSVVLVASHLSEEPGQEQPRLQGDVEESGTMEGLDKGADRDRAARRYRNRIASVATDSSAMDIC